MPQIFKLMLSAIVVLCIPISMFAQSAKEIEKKRLQDSVLKKQSLDQVLLRKGLIPNENFRERYVADFTKFLLTGPATGNLTNYTTITIDKPNAALSYVIKPKNSFKFLNQGFFNLGINGGVETGVINLISKQKPATSYMTKASYSQLVKPFYFYFDTSRYNLDSKIKKEYDKMYVADVELKEEARLKKRIDSLIPILNLFHKMESSTANTRRIKADSINPTLDIYSKSIDSLKKLKSKIAKKVAFSDSVFNKGSFSSQGLLWFTLTQQAGGLKFLRYDPNDVANSYRPKQSTESYESSLTINYYYKSTFGSLASVLLKNSLITIGGSLGYYNNFAELVSSEQKESFKKENAAKDSTFTKGNTFTVYPGEFKTYHAGKIWAEAYKMFFDKGEFGIRAKIIRDMPYRGPRSAQNNLETGIVFNSVSSADSKTKISFEVFCTFFDLGGKNLEAVDVGQKFYKRNSIGVKTAIPLNF